MSRVLLAMSGGVDSATAGFLLKQEGHDVIGVTMNHIDKQWYRQMEGIAPLPEQGIEDAISLAKQLKIPHSVLNLQEPFYHSVVQYFIKEYALGRTPNPCAVCNKKIKFGLLWEKAKQWNCDYLATGHYARILQQNNTYLLARGKDEKKDQSYFLFDIDKDILPHILFPLGSFHKTDTLQLAEKHHLRIQDKKESQEVCFIGKDNYRQFLQQFVPEQFHPGEIQLKDGTVLGMHKGIINYTIGQRKGLGIGYQHPLYVLELDLKRNIVVVGRESEQYQQSFRIKDIHIHNLSLFNEDEELSVKIRYQSPSIPCRVRQEQEMMHVSLSKPVAAITPGQAAVFYIGETIAGGGWICSP